MYKQYFKQAWNLMKQNRFFSTVYIIGTGLAISMVMVMAVVYHIRTANIAPEVHRDRICYVRYVSYRMNDDKGSLNSSCGPRFLKEVIYNLKTPEAVAVTTDPSITRFMLGDIFVQVPGHEEMPKVNLLGCNDQFWKVYSFNFREGKPFTEADFESGLPRVVLAGSLARRLFGENEATGQTLLINEARYTVSGVVADVSGITSDVYAEVWVPYSSLNAIMKEMTSEDEGSAGPLIAKIQLRDAKDIGTLTDELAESVKRYNTGLAGGQVTYGKPVSYADYMIGSLFYKDRKQTYFILAVVLLLFLLVPALNLSGLNTSHMQDRIPEGLRGIAFDPVVADICREYDTDVAGGNSRVAVLVCAGVSFPEYPVVFRILCDADGDRQHDSSFTGDAVEYGGVLLRFPYLSGAEPAVFDGPGMAGCPGEYNRCVERIIKR